MDIDHKALVAHAKKLNKEAETWTERQLRLTYSQRQPKQPTKMERLNAFLNRHEWTVAIIIALAIGGLIFWAVYSESQRQEQRRAKLIEQSPWEWIGTYTYRMKVPGGWMVSRRVPGNGMTNPTETSQFVKDPSHSWQPSIK